MYSKPTSPPLAPLTRAVRGALFCGLIGLSTLPTGGWAQQSTQHYDIPAGALDDTLNRFARAAGITLAGTPQHLTGQRSPGLKGDYSIEMALNLLLSGSGLEAIDQGNGNYVLQAMPDSGPMGLDVMTVVDNALGTITENTKSYTLGTIASATRLVLTPRETPQTVTVVTRQHMDDFNLTNVDEVLEHTPGITVVKLDNLRSEYYARGYQINNFQYDGIPIIADGVNYMGQTTSDMIQYDRLELIKGASGLTTGAGTPGATLNLVRKKPTNELSGHITAEAGRWDNYRTEWDIGGPLNESGNIRGRVAASFQDKQSFQDDVKEQTRALYGILEVDLSPQTMLTFGGNYDKKIPDGTMYGGIPFWNTNNNEIHVSRSFNPAASWSHSEQFSHALFAQLDHEFDNGWSSRLYYTFQRNAYNAKLGSILDAPSADDDSASLFSLESSYKIRNYALEGYARGPFELFGRTHELAIGASGYYGHRKSSVHYSRNQSVDNFWEWSGDIERPDWGGIRRRREDRINQRAYYASGRFSLTDDLAVILGGRVTNYKRGGDSNMRETGEVIPFAGITYDLNDNLSIYASYTKIFMPQSSRDENYAVLQPDEGDSYEGGFKGEWFNGRLNASLAYFEIRQDNRAEYVQYNYEQDYDVYKRVKAKTKGVELEVTGELMPRWNIQAGFTHQVAREDRTNRKISTQTPENQFKIYTNYRLPGILSKFTIGGGASYQGTTWRNGSDYLGNAHQYRQEAFWLLNLMSKYQVTKNISATLNINNLLDKYYYTNYGSDNSYMYGEPRNMMLTTRWDF